MQPPENADSAGCFVLLDDNHASADKPSSRLYTRFVKEYLCEDTAQLDTLWQHIDADLKNGLHASVFIDYEWGAKLQGTQATQDMPLDHSALRVLLFQNLAFLSAAQVHDWLQAQDNGHANPGTPAGTLGLIADISEADFASHIDTIHQHIRAGETYQVNYTYRIQGSQWGNPCALYRRLRVLQPVSYGVLARLKPTGATRPEWVLSRSPELFLRHDQGTLTARPMKGTAARSPDAVLDLQNAHWLATDPKNRAENVMIVDLLRNDLARISETGSVKVPKLLALETYSTVHQMTSTVQSTLQTGVPFPQILRALFPCGSITGAPKIQTMRHIAALETSPRGLYCGAIGWIDAPRAAEHSCGDFCLNVAIRTLTLGPAMEGLRPATLGVGGGIVIDSVAQHEWVETQIKARFLTQLDPSITLFETIKIQRGRPLRLDAHLARLCASARQLGFMVEKSAIRSQLQDYIAPLDISQNWRLRIDLQSTGQLKLQHAPLDPLPAGKLTLILAPSPLSETEHALSAHKTSLRSTYDRAIAIAQSVNAFDALFFNSKNELTEGARSSIWLQIDGKWWTPPLSCGVLPGITRARLLRFQNKFAERTLYLSDLKKAKALMVCNALRGIRQAELAI